MWLARRKTQNPFGALGVLQDEIDNLFNFPFRSLSLFREDYLAPDIDLSEDKENIYLEADLPGIDKKNIKINIKDGILAISGKKEETKEEKDKGYFRRERTFGNFYRGLRIPTSIDSSKIKANYKDGVIRVTLPKSEKAKEKEKEKEIPLG